VAKQFQAVFVLTSSGDTRTQAACADLGVPAVVSEAWRQNDANFNKSAALTDALRRHPRADADDWILLLDADILLPEHLDIQLNRLDRAALYSVPRRLCQTKAEWDAFVAGRRDWSSFPLDNPPTIDGKIWGKVPTRNPAGLMGYFQLWHFSALRGRALPPSRNAASYDVRFALSFAESRRHGLQFEVLHLGPIRMNWNGRVSPVWE
jgi:hypothetical protein